MRKRRKTNTCPNCGFRLKKEFEFCPQCGQENNDQQVSFGYLASDFFANYFSLDSGFARTWKPLFSRPGFLTREYMEGKRARYANPVRLYLVISLIHFFILSIYSDLEPGNASIIKVSNSTPSGMDSTESSPVMIFPEDEEPDTLKAEEDQSWPFSSQDWKLIKSMGSNNKYTVDDISDSLQLDNRPFMQRYLGRQAIKIVKSDVESIQEYLMKNIPVLMFLLLPMYALVLKLFFRRLLYINHIIQSIYIHSFMFLVLSVYWLLALTFGGLPEFAGFIVFFILLVYLVFAFKNAYLITGRRAIWKVLLSGVLYWIIFSFAFILEVIITLLTF